MRSVSAFQHRVRPSACSTPGETNAHLAHPPVVSSAFRFLTRSCLPMLSCRLLCDLGFWRDTYLMQSTSERKIDSIEHRLNGITTLLHELKTHTQAISNNGTTESQEPSHIVAWASAQPDTSESFPTGTVNSTAVEGESSLSAHSVFVDNFLHSFSDGMQPDPEIQATMNTLSHIASASNTHSEARKLAMPKTSMSSPVRQRKFKLPPIREAVNLTQAAQGEHASAQTHTPLR